MLQQKSGRGCGTSTDLLAVVHGIGLQVVANVGHDEKGGDVAQLRAPAVLFLQVPAGMKLEAKVLQREGEGKGAARANLVHPSAHPACRDSGQNNEAGKKRGDKPASAAVWMAWPMASSQGTHSLEAMVP